METKKNKKANLEKMKSLFFIISLGIVFALLNYAFNIQSKTSENKNAVGELISENDLIPITRPTDEKKKLKPQIAKHIITDILNIVTCYDKIDTTEFIVPDFNDDLNLCFVPEEKPDEPIYKPTVKPKFPGGITALQAFIARQTEYPELAKQNNIQGTVYMKFEVTKTGTIGRIEILNKTVDILLKNEAVKVIKKLPKFTPGIQNGKPVSVWFSLPVSFKLS